MRAVFISIFLSFFFLPNVSVAADYLDEMGCVAYDDTPICYKPSFVFEGTDPMFEHWIAEKIEIVNGICTVTFHSVSEADLALNTLEESVQQQIYYAGTWRPWMDFDIEIWNNGCQKTGLTA